MFSKPSSDAQRWAPQGFIMGGLKLWMVAAGVGAVARGAGARSVPCADALVPATTSAWAPSPAPSVPAAALPLPLPILPRLPRTAVLNDPLRVPTLEVPPPPVTGAVPTLEVPPPPVPGAVPTLEVPPPPLTGGVPTLDTAPAPQPVAAPFN